MLLVVSEIACYQPGNLSGSCKALDWSALGQNKSIQLLDFCFGLFTGKCVSCIPASQSQCTFPVPVSCWISKCYRDSSRDTAAAQIARVPTKCTWLQLVQGLFLSYCLFVVPLTRWASSQIIRLKLRPQEEWKQSKPKLQMLSGIAGKGNWRICSPWNSYVNVLKNLQLPVWWEKIHSGRIQWNMKRQIIQNHAPFS